MLRYFPRPDGNSNGSGPEPPRDPRRPAGKDYSEPRPFLSRTVNEGSPTPRNERVAMNRVPSFTEGVLLNRWVLRLIFPPNVPFQCMRNGLDFVRESSSDNPKSSGYLYWIAKTVRAPLRVVTIWATGRMISPLGAIFYGAMTVLKSADYYFTKLSHAPPGEKNKKWLCVEAYAKAFLSDLTSFLFIENISPPFERQWTVLSKGEDHIFKSGAILLIPVILLEIVSYELAATLLTAQPKEHSKMHASLRAWNQLGLIDSNGNLLSLNATDSLPENL